MALPHKSLALRRQGAEWRGPEERLIRDWRSLSTLPFSPERAPPVRRRAL